MPQIPILTGTSVKEAPLQGGQLQTPDVSSGLRSLAGGLSDAATAADKVALIQQKDADNTAVRAIDTDTATKLASMLADPNTGFLGLKGKNALDAFPAAQEQLQKISQDASNAAGGNRRIAEAVANLTRARLASTGEQLARHAQQQNESYQLSTSASRAEASLQLGAANPADEATFQSNLAAARGEAVATGQLAGWDEATTQQKQVEMTDRAYNLRYQQWRQADPVAALADFQKNRGAISPLASVGLYHSLFESAAPLLAQQINAAGGPDASPAPAPAGGTPTDATANGPTPRNERNFNPGNVVRSSTAWEGEVAGADPKFASFESPEAGLRAMGKTLLTYQDGHGLNTIDGIIARWAPASENDPAKYAATVSAALGVKPSDPIDLHDGKTMGKLMSAMIGVEGGRQPYSAEQIAAGVAAASGGAYSSPVADRSVTMTPLSTGGTSAADAWRNPNAPTGNATVDALPADFRLHVLQLARSQAAQDMAGARDALRAKVQDASSAYLTTGSAPNPPQLAEFIQAYGQHDGQAQYSAFQDVARLGQNLQQVAQLPNAGLQTMLDQAKPVPGPGFAVAQRNFEILSKAVEQTAASRAADPIAFAQTAGGYGIQALSGTSPAQMEQEFARRAAAAPRIAADYGTAPAVLSKDEAKALSATLKAAPVEQQKQLLGAMAKGIGDMGLMKAAMQSIAPDQPVMALAGIYQARGNRTTGGVDSADLLLRGQAILTPNKATDGTGHEGGASLIKMPESRLMLSEFNAATGSAFAARPQAADLFQQATKAIYAAKSADAGDYSGNFDATRWKQSIALATGGVQSLNGSDIVMPYGMPLDRFQGIVKDQAPALAASAINVQPDELRHLPLENVGDGRYLFRRGAGYLVDKSGRPVVLSVGGAQ